MRLRPVEKIIDTKRLGTDKKRYTYLRTSTMTTKLRVRLYRLYVVGNLIDLTVIYVIAGDRVDSSLTLRSLFRSSSEPGCGSGLALLFQRASALDNLLERLEYCSAVSSRSV